MSQEQQQVGIYSGTFDPIHLGHLAFAAQAMKDCGLDVVVFLPEPHPRRKQNVTKLTRRAAMIALAVESEPDLELLQLSSPQFTVKGTLPKLQAEYPGAHLTFLMGSDVAKSLHYWNNVKMLLRCASLAIGMRENDDPTEITAAMEQLSKESGLPVEYTLITNPNAGISSTRIRAGLAGTTQVPASVLEYMEQNDLYSASPDTDRA